MFPSKAGNSIESRLYNKLMLKEVADSFEVITTSSTFTATKKGTYTFFIVGGGASGGASCRTDGSWMVVTGGGAGEVKAISCTMSAGDTATITIGGGGSAVSTGGISNNDVLGNVGGNSSVKLNNIGKIITSAGGAGGKANVSPTTTSPHVTTPIYTTADGGAVYYTLYKGSRFSIPEEYPIATFGYFQIQMGYLMRTLGLNFSLDGASGALASSGTATGGASGINGIGGAGAKSDAGGTITASNGVSYGSGGGGSVCYTGGGGTAISGAGASGVCYVLFEEIA